MNDREVPNSFEINHKSLFCSLHWLFLLRCAISHSNFYLFPAGIDLYCQLKLPLSSVYSQTINNSLLYQRNLGHTPQNISFSVKFSILFPFLFPTRIQPYIDKYDSFLTYWTLKIKTKHHYIKYSDIRWRSQEIKHNQTVDVINNKSLYHLQKRGNDSHFVLISTLSTSGS